MSASFRRALWTVALGAFAWSAASVAVAADASPQCVKAKRKVAREEAWEVRGEATIEHERKARATCATRAVCERYDAQIRAMETRKARHGTRLAKLKADAAKACSAG